MKKVFDSFYVFSKFSLSFILLLCVFFLIYLLYTNYQNEDEVSKFEIELENELKENINKNSEFIKNISKEILETKTALTNIEKLIKENSNKESKIDLTSINETIELLNKNFNSLSYEISTIKNKNTEDQSNNNPELVNKFISEITLAFVSRALSIINPNSFYIQISSLSLQFFQLPLKFMPVLALYSCNNGCSLKFGFCLGDHHLLNFSIMIKIQKKKCA